MVPATRLGAPFVSFSARGVVVASRLCLAHECALHHRPDVFQTLDLFVLRNDDGAQLNDFILQYFFSRFGCLFLLLLTRSFLSVFYPLDVRGVVVEPPISSLTAEADNLGIQRGGHVAPRLLERK